MTPLDASVLRMQQRWLPDWRPCVLRSVAADALSMRGLEPDDPI